MRRPTTTTTTTTPYPLTTALLPQGTAEQPRGAAEPSPSGAVVIFDWVETLRDLLSRTDYASAPAAAAAAAAGAAANARDSPSSTARIAGIEEGEEEEEEEPLEAECGLEEDVEIVHGQAFTDRKSTFQAHLAQVTSENQVWDQLFTYMHTSCIAGSRGRVGVRRKKTRLLYAREYVKT